LPLDRAADGVELVGKQVGDQQAGAALRHAKYHEQPRPAREGHRLERGGEGALVQVLKRKLDTCLLIANLFPDKLHTVGPPVEGHDIRLIDDDGNEVPQAQWARSSAARRR